MSFIDHERYKAYEDGRRDMKAELTSRCRPTDEGDLRFGWLEDAEHDLKRAYDLLTTGDEIAARKALESACADIGRVLETLSDGVVHG